MQYNQHFYNEHIDETATWTQQQNPTIALR